MSDRAELSALSTALTDLVDRIAALASNLDGQARDDVGQDLFEVERTLTAASRRLARAVDSLPGG